MRLASIASTLLLTALLPPSASAFDDEAVVRAHFTSFADAWVTGNARAVAAGYADDADIVRPNQPPVTGRAAIETFYEQMFAGPLKGVAKTMRVDRVRFVSAEVAVVDGSYTLDRQEPALHAKGASVTVLAKRDGRWVTVVSRSYRLP
jgi:uncharacterized protein (TIGR02246 family)